MYPTEVPINEENVAKLTSLMKRAYLEIVNEIKGATTFGASNRSALLKQIEIILSDTGTHVASFVEDELPYYYELGASDATKQMKDIGLNVKTGTGFNRIHKEAIRALIDDTARSFGESLTGINRSANKLLSKAVRNEITERMAIGKIGGKTLNSIKTNIVGLLEQDGLSALIDKGGRAWELDRYSEMLIRTKSVEARNRGMANRMVENGYDLVQVSNHSSEHAVCAYWEGKILSLTGHTKGYPTIAQAEAAGLFHPNCKHAINAYVQELANLTQSYTPLVDVPPLDTTF